jgi:hypothetical protein
MTTMTTRHETDLADQGSDLHVVTTDKEWPAKQVFVLSSRHEEDLAEQVHILRSTLDLLLDSLRRVLAGKPLPAGFRRRLREIEAEGARHREELRQRLGDLAARAIALNDANAVAEIAELSASLEAQESRASA